jgi:hypothetical protein
MNEKQQKPVKLIFVRPVEGRRVKDPFTFKVLAPEGEHKPDTSFWRRRLNDGDVVLGEVKEVSAKAARKQEVKE